MISSYHAVVLALCLARQLFLCLAIAVRDQPVQQAAGLALVVAVELGLLNLALQVRVCFLVCFVGRVVCCGWGFRSVDEEGKVRKKAQDSGCNWAWLGMISKGQRNVELTPSVVVVFDAEAALDFLDGVHGGKKE